MDAERIRETVDVRQSYAGKFAGLLLAIMLLTAAVSGVIYTTVGNEIRTDTEASLQTSAGLEADRLDSWFGVMTREAKTLPRAVAFRSEDSFHATDQLHQLTARKSVSGAYFYNRTDGRTVATAGSDSVVADGNQMQSEFRDRSERLLTSTDDRTIYSQPFRSSATGTPQLLLLSRAPSDENKVLAVLIDLEKLSNHIFGTGETTQQLRVVNQAGTVVLAPDTDAILANDPIAPERFGSRQGTITTDGTDEQAVGYATAEEPGWVVTQRVPTETAYQLQQTVSTQILALLGVLMGGLIVIGLTLGRSTVRSITDLSERAKAVRSGDLETPLESSRRDEIGELYASFDAMRESLEERIEELKNERKRAEVARSEVVETNEYLRSTAAEYSMVMEAAAGGDLSRRMESDGENDAMDAIAEDFNVMIGELEQTTGQIKRFADHVEESGEVVETNATSVRMAAEQVAESVQRIADETYHRRDELRAATDTVGRVVDALEANETDRARDRLEELAESLSALAESTDATMAETETVAGAAEEQAAELNEVGARANRLLRYVGPLQEILDRFEAEAEHEFVFSGGPSIVSENRTDD